MLFNSFSFLLFFPFVTIVYFILPYRYRWIWLLFASCGFYIAFIPVYILILAVTISIDYGAAILMESREGRSRKLILILSLCSTALVLFIFKYLNFFISSFSVIAQWFGLSIPDHVFHIILPIGLSFHTFQSMAYVIEVYWKKQKAEKHFGIYSLYVMFYPQLVAGPIERPQNLLTQFYEAHDFNYKQATEGLKQMAWGFFKKLVIADRLAQYVHLVYDQPDAYKGFPVVVATVFFAYQIYCDFSGYTDIAIGAARVMGFRLKKNFNLPYGTESVTEFWRRWHISLSTWFRDYLYIPLGGSRVSIRKIYFNLAIVFLISGLWHGANWTFIIWGALHGIYVIAEKILNLDSVSKKISIAKKIFRQAITFSLICFAWIFFRAGSVTDAFQIIRSMVSLDFLHPSINIISTAYLYFSISVILILELVQWKMKNQEFYFLMENYPRPARLLAYHALIISILVFGVFNQTQFIYFQF